VRTTLISAGLAGATLLVLATFTTVIRIRARSGAGGGEVDTHLTGYDRHSVALVLIAVFGVVMIVGALQNALPAMAALAAGGLLAVLITVIGDAPHIHDTGFVRQYFDTAASGAGIGFYFETLGAVLLLISGAGLLILRDRGEAPPEGEPA
jgi:hypothetical protein